MIPLRLYLIAGAFILALAGVGGAGLYLHAKWVAEGVATIQPKLDQANRDVATLTAANATSDETIAVLQADNEANQQLIDQYADRVAAFNQQADDTAATIRKLQNDDKTVDAFLRTPIPDALRGLLNDRGAGATDRGANQNGHAAAAKTVAVPAARH